MSVGRWIGFAARGQQPAARVDLVRLEQRVADRAALGGEEREAHRPADGQRVDDRPSSASMTPSLSLTLAPPRIGDERARRAWSAARRAPRPRAAAAGPSPTAVPRRPDDRGVGAVRRAEGVVDVAVDALDEPIDERGVVALLAGVEAQVLEQLDAGRELGEPRRAPASIEYCGSGAPFGRPRWLAVTTGRRARAATRSSAARRGCGSRR